MKLHQERMARARNRPVENKWIGQRMSEPEVDLAAMGRAQGATGLRSDYQAGRSDGRAGEGDCRGRCGGVAVVDVRVEPGYTAK